MYTSMRVRSFEATSQGFIDVDAKLSYWYVPAHLSQASRKLKYGNSRFCSVLKVSNEDSSPFFL